MAAIDISAPARAEYAARLAKCETLAKRGELTHPIADRLHHWQRIAWLLDRKGRSPGEQLLIFPEDLSAMAREALHCAGLARAAAEAEPAKEVRAGQLYLIARSLEARAQSREARP